MSFCSNCGAELHDGSKFCSNCGAPNQVGEQKNQTSERRKVYVGSIKKCPSCGEKIQSFTVICPACGHELNSAGPMSITRYFERGRLSRCPSVYGDLPQGRSRS